MEKGHNMKIYMYGSLAESFNTMSLPWKGMVEFTMYGDLKGYSGLVYYLEPFTTERMKRFNLAFIGTLEA